MNIKLPSGLPSAAVISECGLYRYTLERRPRPPSAPSLLPNLELRGDRGTLLVVMLNPSTADASQDDATIRSLNRLATAWGYGAFIVLNLYAYRSTDPAALKTVTDPVGPLNDQYLAEYAKLFPDVLVGWGNHAEPQRAQQVLDLLQANSARIYTVGRNKNGSPKHPLYTGRSTPQQPFI